MSTRSKLEQHGVTVSFSNCTSASGNLTIAECILMKAPMTAHRLRYFQSLRQLLPPTTSAFNFLLHKRTPLEQQIPHIAVQSRKKTVHSLTSKALANILTGNGCALYIPWFALSQMTVEEAMDLFATHDAQVNHSNGSLSFLSSQIWTNHAETITWIEVSLSTRLGSGLGRSKLLTGHLLPSVMW